MEISEDEKIINDENNKKTKVVTKSYICSVCHTFVKSDVKREPFINIKK